ncbi:MAG: hypothetical protein FWD09_07645 [Lentimicrobiaceae bacterium]|nr:hypothetical protein [Lentimicrobiaceae bacterium]
MKKLALLSVILMATCVVAMAQPRAIGGRLAWNIGASYQHSLGEKNMIQVDLDFPSYFWGIQGTATYNWIFPIKSWPHAGSWNWYAGVGAGVGYKWYNSWLFSWNNWSNWDKRVYRGVFVGVAGMIGIEYNFKFPLQLSLDWRPVVGPIIGRKYNGNIGADFYGEGLITSAFALGVRYKF